MLSPLLYGDRPLLKLFYARYDSRLAVQPAPRFPQDAAGQSGALLTSTSLPSVKATILTLIDLLPSLAG